MLLESRLTYTTMLLNGIEETLVMLGFPMQPYDLDRIYIDKASKTQIGTTQVTRGHPTDNLLQQLSSVEKNPKEQKETINKKKQLTNPNQSNPNQSRRFIINTNCRNFKTKNR